VAPQFAFATWHSARFGAVERKGFQAGSGPATIATTGYARILAGPAAVRFVAQAVGLAASFWLVAALMCLMPLSAGTVAR
jgi:hypothetical protein